VRGVFLRMNNQDQGMDVAREHGDEGEYDIGYFKENGFVRKKCKKCGSWFWTRDRDRDTCGDAPCEIYSFIGAPLFKEHSPEEIRESFLSFFELRNHTRMKRYPVVARWRDDIYLNIASIANFQPLITSGSVPPPANPLVISQPCIRLEDLHSIGKSGRHLTMFEMMGHHAFNKRGEKEIYWKNETVQYCDEFLKQLGVAEDGITYKEAPWVGGGNAGPCLEVIAGGLELATLVFMDLEAVHSNTNGDTFIRGQWYRKMETYIVDTGYGLERFVWASKGTPTVYDAIFPEVIEELLGSVGMEHPKERYYNELIEIARLSGVMNKREIAMKLQLSDDFFDNILEPLETVYAVADHTRCLAFMLADGVVPSNAKEGYLARLVIRRALRMLKSLECDMPLEELVALHIKLLRKSFPELMESVDLINEILELERRRYEETLSKGERIIRQMVMERKKGISVDTLINLYDTYGIPPEFTREVASRIKNANVNVDINIPEDFYSRVAKMHGEAKRQEEDMALVSLKERTKTIPKTRRLYYEEPESTVFSATVLDYFDRFIVLDKTLFYPEGGGQPADTGVIRLDTDTDTGTGTGTGNELKVVDVRDVEGVILHEIDTGTDTDMDAVGIEIERGKQVSGSIDYRRRMAHTRHHSATHIVIWAARKVLGRHVWQAGAQKGELRSRLDITHFKRISDAERREIEKLANEMVMRDEDISASFVERNEAERRYGFRIYQGGVPPGKELRIVRIGADEDVQACAGTHCSKTGEVGPIKILRTERIQDGIERLWYSAGEAAVMEMQARDDLIKRSASVLRIPEDRLPETVERFFSEWKQLRKENERLRAEIAELHVSVLKAKAQEIGGIKVIAEVIPDADEKELMRIASRLSTEGFVALLLSRIEIDNRVAVVSSVPDGLELDAAMIVKRVCHVLGGGGGGTAKMARGGGERIERMGDGIAAGLELMSEQLKAKG